LALKEHGKEKKEERREHVGIGNSKHWSLKLETFN